MAGLGDITPSSSPISATLSATASKEEALTFYKTQYEQLATELEDFQTSSQELEAELEKDVEEAEKRERLLREKLEAMGYEVEEWKSKCKQSKEEANRAQNLLQKEITTLRDTSRTLQMKLRDIEVANDDFEKQARNTTSSLEDLESKYNVALERSVILEEEVKTGEQERETLRIETQRLRDELSDLKVEAEIRQDKLRNAEATVERSRLRKPTPLGASVSRPQSSVSEHSPATTASSPTIATPPTKSTSSINSDTQTPPSPPTSDRSLPAPTITPAQHPKSRLTVNNSITPRANHYSTTRAPRHSRGPSAIQANTFVTPASRRTTLSRTEPASSSTSLTQIRGLIGKVQKLEQRVQSARSKLPAPTGTPPRASPRPGSSLSQAYIPSTITVRSSRKRTSASHTTSGTADSSGDQPHQSSHFTRPSSRLSFGLPPPTPTRDLASSSTHISTTPSHGHNTLPRPSSRASLSSRASISHLAGTTVSVSGSSSRPASRQSISGARTPLGHYPTNADRIARPRSSMGGSYAAAHGAHGHSASVSASASSSRASDYGLGEREREVEEANDAATPTPSRRSVVGTKDAGTAIPAPGRRRRQSGADIGRRTSSGPGVGVGGMPPPERRRKLSGVGETF